MRDGEALVEGDEGALSLPDTVQGVIRARLDNLDPQALEIVRVASVIGWEFDHALLAEVVAAGRGSRGRRSPPWRPPASIQQTIGRADDRLSIHARADAGGLLRQPRRAPAQGAARRDRARARVHARRPDWTNAARCSPITSSRAEDWPAAIRFGRRAAERAIALSQFADALATLDQVLEWARHVCQRRSERPRPRICCSSRSVCARRWVCARASSRSSTRLIAHLARDGSSARLAEVYLRQGDLSTLLKRFDAADRALGTALRIGQERGRHRRWCAARCGVSGFSAGTKDGMPKRSTSRGGCSPSIGSATTRSRSPST